MYRKIFTALSLLLFFATASVASNVNLLGATPEMARAEFWISRTKDVDKVLMTPEELAAFSRQIQQTEGTHCVDVLSYQDILTSADLRLRIDSFALPTGPRYIGDKEVGADYWSALDRARNLQSAADYNIVRFGVPVRNCALRSFPTDDVCYTEPNDVEFDMNMESQLKVWEPVAVLYESADGLWYCVRCATCQGWAKKENIAIADKSLLRGLFARDFAVVTGNRIMEDVDHNTPKAERPELTMGTRLPLADQTDSVAGVSTLYSHAVLLPQRGTDGSLTVRTARLPFSADLSKGFLPYTQRNIINQAFKMLGERYGWGGMWGVRDCSAFAKDVYSVFGIELPRNSGWQSKIPSYHADLSEMAPEDKAALIMKQPAGAILQMSGHIMMYIGRYKDKPYMINDMYGIYPANADVSIDKRTIVNCVAVSGLDVKRKSGKTALESLLNLNSVIAVKP